MSKPTDSQQVDQYISRLEAPLAETVKFIRQTLLSADPEISEHIKWNSPAFYYPGEMKAFDPKEYKRDLVVLNLHRGKILMVFPTGTVIDEGAEILEGKYTDGRRMISIKDLSDAKQKAEGIVAVVKNWMSKIEK